MIQVRVFAFGMLKDSLGAEASEIALREGSTVADLLAEVSRAHPAAPLRGIAVSVNAEYATAEQVLRQGDEIGLLPPVSGGSAAQQADLSGASDPAIRTEAIRTELTRDRINTAQLAEAAKRGEDSRFQVSRLQDVKAGRRNTIGSTTPWHKTCRRGHDCSGMLAPTTNAASPL